ncbi:MAG TPA: TAXI family TRAP transporter solute-binding subunit [Burkholderiales bacterium]|nr:TAXI family TRAP transporter solute-binding subunit [Burkholderiales bacterium]
MKRPERGMSGSRRAGVVAGIAAVAVLAFSVAAPADAQQRKSIRWTTSQIGSYGYTIAASMAKIVEQALGGEYTVTVHPYTSPTVAMKAVMDGEGEIAYTADIGMSEFHGRVGGFKDYKPARPELVHTWYAYPMESMMAIAAKDAEKFKCWKDLSGKPVFYTQAGFMNWLNWQRIYKALGYDFKHVQIDLKSNADSLQAGTIVASATYTTAGKSLAAYWKETEVRMDIRIVNPCPDEVAKIKSAGLAVVDVDPKGAFAKDVGPKTVQGVPILFGYNARIDMPEDVVYRMVKAFYDKRDELVKVDAGFSVMAKDFVALQVQGINANPGIAVHPGLARFLKEQKAWNDKWKVAAAAAGK